jgi:hypothetical protein
MDEANERVVRIDCSECVLEHTAACDDCVVGWLIARDPGGAVVVEAGELDALRSLARAGLAPVLRHRRRRLPIHPG